MENLDSLFPSDLWSFWQKHLSGNYAGDLFPGLPHGAAVSVAVTAHLADYARFKATAMEHRAVGRIALAQFYEAQCDRIYEILPEWARDW